MRKFVIKRPNEGIKPLIVGKIDNLTKPKGSLGRLEELALQIGLIQQTLEPKLLYPNHVVFAADHGIVEEGVSFSPKEVTWQQIGNFLKGGAGINFLCRQHDFCLTIVDSGVDFDFPAGCGVVDMKIAKGTANFLYGAAMSIKQMELCIERGAQVVDSIKAKGCNVICFGEMGIGNTSPSSMWMSYLGGIPLRDCVGAGSGMIGTNLLHKLNVLEKSAANYQVTNNTVFNKVFNGIKSVGGFSVNDITDEQMRMDYIKEIMCWFGGFEMVMTVGAMLRAAELGMLVLVDGFIMTNCMLVASSINKNILAYSIFGHCGDEIGHKKVLDIMNASPLLNMGFRLGEGTGAICAYPIVESAVRMINEMETFSGASVTKYF